MLTSRSARIRAGVLLAGALLVLVPVQVGFAPPASACSEKASQDWNLVSADLSVTCADDAQSQPETPGASTPGGGTTGQPVAEERHCFRGASEVDCTMPGGLEWNGQLLCYDRVIDPPLPADHPRWEGHLDASGNPEGVIVACFDYIRCYVPESDALRLGCDFIKYRWEPQAPGATGPAPAEVARDVVASMRLRAGQVGMAPPSYTERPGSQFIVGIQAWLWVDDPLAVTTGPLTASDPSGALTATATVDRVVFDMGDGNSVTCTPRAGSSPGVMEVGTRWTAAWGEADSPDCGYTYTRAGDYTITARTYWTASWSGMGESGTIPIDVQTSVPVRVGEVQVLTVS